MAHLRAILDTGYVEQISAERAWTTPESRAVATWRDLEPYLERIDPVSADMVEMCVRDEMTQEAVGAVFGVTQAAVSGRIRAALRRVQILRTLPPERDLEALAEWAVSRGLRGAPQLAAYVRCWSQQRVAESVGGRQHRVRCAIVRCLGLAASAASPHAATASAVLRALLDRTATRLSGARLFVLRLTVPTWTASLSDPVPSPAAVARFRAMVEEWEGRHGLSGALPVGPSEGRIGPPRQPRARRVA